MNVASGQSIDFTKFLKFLLLMIVSLAALVVLSSNDVSALSQPANEAQAINRINELCAQGNKVAHSGYVSSQSFNEWTGVVNYNLTVLWKKCPGAASTRAYAITGYPSFNGLTICPNVGYYGNSAYGPTHDCVKHIGSPWWSGSSSIDCAYGRNGNCVTFPFWNGIAQGTNEPSTSLQRLTIGLSGTVPNWSAVSGRSGSASLGGANVLCSFYKDPSGRGYNQGQGGRMCQDVVVNVQWRRPWTINGQTYIGSGTIQDSQRRNNTNYRPSQGGVQTFLSGTPGQTFHWNHLLRNNGPYATDRNLRVNIDQLTFDVGTFNNRGGNTGFTVPNWTNSPANPNVLIYEAYQNPPLSRFNHTVTQNDVGRRVCQRVAWNPGSSATSDWSWAAGGSGWQTGGYDCIDVPYDYNLYPTISSSALTVSVGEKIELDTRVLNDGSTKSNGDSSTSIYEYVIPADRTDEVNDFKALFDQRATNVGPGNLTVDYRQYRSAASNLNDGCDRITEEQPSFSDIPCQRVHGQGVVVPDGNGAGYSRQVSTESRHTAGSVVCYVFLINNLSQNVDRQEKRASAPSCVSVGKRPSMQVLGGDVRVRGEIRTSIKTIDPEFMDVTAYDGNSTFGSWTEFGTMSAYRNQAMASAEGLRRGSTSSTQSGWSDLTFANILPDELDPEEDTYQYGFFEGLPSPSRIAEYFAGKESTSVSGSVNVAGRNGVYAPDESVDIIDLSGTANGSVVIYAPDETVNITDNITLDDTTIGSLSDLAQVVIIAKDITIASDVNRVDAWLIASDYISTCAGRNLAAPALTVTRCSQPLTVTGPVATSELYLFRTAGSEYDEAIRDPAEIFNLRPDAYLWALSYADDRGYPETAAVSELPPRY